MMYNPNPYSLCNNYHRQPTMEDIGIEKVNKMIDEYLAEDSSLCVIKWAIDHNQIEKLKELYTKYSVFREQLVYCLYTKNKLAIHYVNEMVTQKYGKDPYMLYKCIDYDFLYGFRFLVSNGYEINYKCLLMAIEQLRYDFVEFIVGRNDKLLSGEEFFKRTYNTLDKKMIQLAHSLGATLDERYLISNFDISGIELVKEIYNYRCNANTLEYVFYYNFENDCHRYTIEKLTKFLEYLKAIDIDNSITWYYHNHNHRLFRKAYTTSGDYNTMAKFKNDFGVNNIDADVLFQKPDIEKLKIINSLYEYKYPTNAIEMLINNKLGFDNREKLYEFLDYVRETDTHKNIAWESEDIIKAVNVNNLYMVKYLVDLGISYNIYNLDLSRKDKIEITLYLLEKIKPLESPLLNMNEHWKLNCGQRAISARINFDLPGFRPLIYMDLNNTNFHRMLRLRAKRKLSLVKYEEKKMAKLFEELDLVEKDVTDYIITKYTV